MIHPLFRIIARFHRKEGNVDVAALEDAAENTKKVINPELGDITKN
jgi:hypothetical protein